MTLSTDQTLPNRVGAGTAQMGLTAGADTNDPLRPVWAGENYVWFPGSTGNTITFPRPYATTHYTITYTDNSTDTGTTTADPVVIGGTAHSGSVVSVVLRETDGAGAIGETLIVADEIDTSADPDAGQDSFGGWTVNRSTSGLKTAVVTRSGMLLDGDDDLVQLQASDTPTFTATTGKHTVIMAYRSHSNPASTRIVMDSRVSSGSGWSMLELLASGATRSVLYGDGGSASSVTPARTANSDIQVAAAVVDTGTLRAWHNETGWGSGPVSTAGVGAITFNPPRVGSTAYTAFCVELETFTCLTFKDQALTEDELDAIATKLIAGAYA